jgi:hypothetical protein
MPVEPGHEPLRGGTEETDLAFARLIGLAGISAETRRRNEMTETAVEECVAERRDGSEGDARNASPESD